jgi:hypothetical protein
MHNILIKALHAENRMIECSLNDHFVLRSPVAVSFFYRKHISSAVIIHALQHVLKDFPIFAGILVRDSEKIYIHCNNQGVNLKIAHYDFNLSTVLANFQKLKPDTFVDLINPHKTLKRKTPVLNIKLSYYKNAMVIGYCWHHSIGDMFTFMEFVKALSSFAKGFHYPTPLIVDNRDRYLQQWYDQEADTHSEHPRLTYLKLPHMISFMRHLHSRKKGMHFYFTQDEITSLRTKISNQAGYQVSKNDALCAHLLETITHCRQDNPDRYHASIIINYRQRIEMPHNLLGNYVDAIPITFSKAYTAGSIANNINARVKNYKQESFQPSHGLKFMAMHGGLKNVYRVVPHELMPKYKNIIFTNWSNFEVYSIDFGVESPYLFLPVGEWPIPWVSSIVEGFENRGALVSLILPSKVAQRLTQPTLLAKIHQYRPQLSHEDYSIIEENSWCL